jgi:3-methyl-2-oxobutanoate hydroxymethyltransferase
MITPWQKWIQPVLMIILVGDSASNVMAGHETTPITLDQMIYHASSVVRAIERALVVGDLPFEVTI